MSIGMARRIIDQDPAFVRKMDEFAHGAATWDYWKKNPLLLGSTVAGVGATVGGAALGAYAGLNPGDEGAQSMAQVGHYLMPLVDSGAEFVSNKHFAGMSNARAGYLAGMSGGGHLGGQYLAKKFLPQNEYGGQNELAIYGAGLVGELVADKLGEMTVDPLAQLGRTMRRIV